MVDYHEEVMDAAAMLLHTRDMARAFRAEETGED